MTFVLMLQLSHWVDKSIQIHRSEYDQMMVHTTVPQT